MASEGALRPRLCHLHKIPDFSGFGFNLHAERGKSGQFIGKIDPGSPAELAGLREGDRIIEVNGTNVANENHSQVVQRIKAVADEVKLLVVDEQTDTYYREQNIVVSSEMDNIKVIENGGTKAEYAEVSPPEPEPETATETVTTPDEEPTEAPLATAGEIADASTTDSVSTTSGAETPTSASFNITEPPHFPSGHRPRLCELVTWPDFSGYGFNLHANKGEPAQFIGKLDPGSPAELGGLREGDRIVEVNGVNIEHEPHQEVVRLVRSVPGRVSLLVVDPATDLYLTGIGATATSTSDDIERIVCPDSKPSSFSAAETVQSEVSEVEQPRPPSEEMPPPYIAPMSVSEDHPHRARLCIVISRKDGRGYGFSMQGQKAGAENPSKAQFIGKVDAGSPAEEAGLRNGDKIVEVNGFNVENSPHKEVVEKIKSVPDRVKLLVVDAEADKYFTNKGITVTSSMEDYVETRTSSEPADALVNGAVAEDHKHRARLCVVRSWKDGKGYGFSMQAQKPGGDGSKQGQFIGKVDVGSPAEAAGLRSGDRIIEVNGTNVEQANHKEVVDKIKSVPEIVKLLVVDTETDKYFSEKSISLSSSMDNCIEKIECPETKTASTATATAATPTATTPTQKAKDADVKPAQATFSASSGSQSPPVVVGGIEFAGSAAEARRRMSKKKSVVEDKRTLKEKHDVFEKM